MKIRTGIAVLMVLTSLLLAGCFGNTQSADSVPTESLAPESQLESEAESKTGEEGGTIAADQTDMDSAAVDEITEEAASEDLEELLKQARGQDLQYDAPIFETDQRLYSMDELRAMPDAVLAVFRNELYARRGRIFTNADWQELFGGFSWYDGVYTADRFDEQMLTELERENLKIVLAVEAERIQPGIFTADTYPRVDGSTATIPLSEQLAADTMGIPVAEARLYVRHNKTHLAYVNLIEGNADIIFVTAPSEDELQMAAEAGVELEIHPVVKEGFVFLVNEKNPVTSLTQRQIRDIYAGTITNWAEVGGPDQAIIPHQRPINSGSQSGMLSLVMGDTPMMEAPKDLYISEMSGLIESISSYANEGNAIGYSYYYYVSSMYFRKGIRLLAVDGVTPEADTIRNGSYPYTTSYYAVIRKSEPPQSGARKLLDWTLRHGKDSIEQAGYVPLN